MQRRAFTSVGVVQRGHRPWHVGKRFVREPGDLPPGRVDAGQLVRIGKARSLLQKHRKPRERAEEVRRF